MKKNQQNIRPITAETSCLVTPKSLRKAYDEKFTQYLNGDVSSTEVIRFNNLITTQSRLNPINSLSPCNSISRFKKIKQAILDRKKIFNEEDFKILNNFSAIAKNFQKRISNNDLVNENCKEKYYQSASCQKIPLQSFTLIRPKKQRNISEKIRRNQEEVLHCQYLPISLKKTFEECNEKYIRNIRQSPKSNEGKQRCFSKNLELKCAFKVMKIE